ncbi:MAG: hypothetical protein JSU72_07150 [Deltaproteobacteria bacterium]|nr:MAG: hypothetical protein JSU72_07150 [Deltaproteobacteria bacterium]
MVLLMLHPSLLYAGKIADLFSTEVLGIRWRSTKEQVAKAFPNGKSRKQFGIQTYTIPDGRPLFETRRNLDNNIQFVFNTEGRMKGVNIGFPSDTDGFKNLLNKLDTYFGKHQSDPNGKSATVAEWPEDNGIKIVLADIGGAFGKVKVVLSIEYVELGNGVGPR